MPIPNPRDSQIHVVRLTDREIRKVTRDAAQEADKIIRSLAGNETVGARVRSAQLSLAKVNAEMWAAVGDATKVGIGDAFDQAAEVQALFDEDLFRATGMSASYWRMSQLAQARAGIDAFIARKENHFTLSQRVYRNTALSRGYVERAINNGLLLNKSVAEIAKDVKGFIDPATPGGASYAAHRLARTEVVGAYHQQARKGYAQTPWVGAVKWNLSGSHPRPDVCNEYAEDSHMPRGEAGVWAKSDVPGKPHPQCLCYITPVTVSDDEFVRRFRNGEYDSYINDQMGCTAIA